jgi:hypothetical protein
LRHHSHTTLSRHERNEYGVGFEAVPHTLAGTAEGAQKMLSEEKVFRETSKKGGERCWQDIME